MDYSEDDSAGEEPGGGNGGSEARGGSARKSHSLNTIYQELDAKDCEPEWATRDELIKAKCPVHDDQDKSLFVGQTEDGSIFGICYKQRCSLEKVFNALGHDASPIVRESESDTISDPILAEERPLATGDLLRRVGEFIERYVVLAESQCVAVALWVLHTHAIEAAFTTPFLSITSAEMECGKTRLLEVLDVLVARPWLTMRTTAAALLRKTDAELPTLLLDESDAAFRGDREYAETLRGLLNSGYRRGGKATVCDRQGGSWVTRDFSAFGPKAIAGIGELPDTVASRSIAIRLKRRMGGENVESWKGYHRVEPDAAPLRVQLAAWASEHKDALAGADPEVAEQLSDRASECWEPLLAIADRAGGDWPRSARDAAIALNTAGMDEAASRGIQLLGAVHDAMNGGAGGVHRGPREKDQR